MKLAVSTLLVGSAAAFSPSLTRRAGTSLAIGREGNVELGGNTWKPDRWVIDANDRLWIGHAPTCNPQQLNAHANFSSAFFSFSLRAINAVRRWEVR